MANENKSSNSSTASFIAESASQSYRISKYAKHPRRASRLIVPMQLKENEMIVPQFKLHGSSFNITYLKENRGQSYTLQDITAKQQKLDDITPKKRKFDDITTKKRKFDEFVTNIRKTPLEAPKRRKTTNSKQ